MNTTGPWQIAAVTLPASNIARTNAKASGSILNESGFQAPPVSRALQYIESNLFESGLNVGDIVDYSLASQATLFRQFRRELQETPAGYIRNRRLDEAHALLTQGDYQVQDVAYLVGYEDLSAFSKAFKQRFCVSPSEVL
jgi:AraC-like DNA-binding protein